MAGVTTATGFGMQREPAFAGRARRSLITSAARTPRLVGHVAALVSFR